MKINELKAGKKATVSGWVDTVRDQKSIMFIVLRDRDGRVQVTVPKGKLPEIATQLEGLQVNSTLTVIGEVVDAPQVKLGGIEIIPQKVEITSRAKVSPIDEKSGVDLLQDYRWIDLRDDKKIDYFRVQTEVLAAAREWFVGQGYIEILTPKLTGFASEGGAEVFEVKYYDKKAYLTQSPQLFKQMGIAGGFEKVFEVTACYRAEKFSTSRHSTEFFAIDVELGFIKDESDVMDAEESMIRHIFGAVNKRCAPTLERLGVEATMLPKGKFPRISLLEAYELLKKERNYDVPKAIKGDLDPEAERLLCDIAREKWGSDFIFVTNFPASARPFYIMKLDENTKLTRGFDLLYRGVEVTSGGQREHRPEILRENIKAKGMNPKDMEFYIQFFEYGCPPHGGFALGIARFVAKMLGLPNVRDATFLFRGPDRLAP